MNTFDEMIPKLKTEIEERVVEIKATQAWAVIAKLLTALNTIEGLSESPKTSLAELFGFSADGETVSVRPGEFIGMDPVEAAKKYMEKKKETASTLDEIIDAIEKGGAERVARDSLANSLARSNWDVVKAPKQELYTLVKFVPHVTRSRKKSKQADATPPDTGAADATPPDPGESAAAGKA
jgi:hypothetical protein